FLVMFSIIILANKVLFLSIRKSQRRFWVDYKKVVILGTGESCSELYDHFIENSNLGYVVQGYFSDKQCPDLSTDFKYLGRLEQSVVYAVKNGISEIFSSLNSEKKYFAKRLMQEADHYLIRFRFVPDLSAIMDKNVMVEYYVALQIISHRR